MINQILNPKNLCKTLPNFEYLSTYIHMNLMFAVFFFILVKPIYTAKNEAELVQASKDANINKVKDLLNSYHYPGGPYVDAADYNQRTALWWAGKSMLKHF